jgi:hypothetical protein
MPKVITITLPDWLSQEGPGRYAVDPDIAYPPALKALGAPAVDQYWLELAYLLVREAAGRLLPGPVSQLRFLRRERWALLAHPPREGLALAGASDDPAVAKLQRELNCLQARKDWRKCRAALPKFLRG